MGDPVSTALLIGVGAKTGAGILQARSEAQGLGFKSGEAAVAARHGKIAADETDAALRRELDTVIGNIRAIRASAGVDPNSPTTRAILAEETKVSDRERRIRVGNIMAQVGSDERAAGQLKKLSGQTWLYGTLGSIGSGLTSVSRSY